MILITGGYVALVLAIIALLVVNRKRRGPEVPALPPVYGTGGHHNHIHITGDPSQGVGRGLVEWKYGTALDSAKLGATVDVRLDTPEAAKERERVQRDVANILRHGPDPKLAEAIADVIDLDAERLKRRDGQA